MPCFLRSSKNYISGLNTGVADVFRRKYILCVSQDDRCRNVEFIKTSNSKRLMFFPSKAFVDITDSLFQEMKRAATFNGAK